MAIDFERELFTFEMANNHQGDLAHAERIIRAMSEITRAFGVRAAIKVQLRHLDTFIHPSARDKDAKHVKRFLETRLDENQFSKIAQMTRTEGLVTMATVFDEESIASFQNIDFDFLKIASCSAQDYPLLRALSVINKPRILSTASLSLDEVAATVEILGSKPLAIMHCVALYPTQNSEMLLDRIDRLKERFASIPIGFSTHEHPDSLLPMQMAVAKGVRLFEKHVDVPHAGYKMNAYSAGPEQIKRWLESYLEAGAVCSLKNADEIHRREKESLISLKRAAFARRDIQSGEILSAKEVAFAIPAADGQLLAEDFLNANKERRVSADISAGDAISNHHIGNSAQPSSNKNSEYAQRALALVKRAGLTLPRDYQLELSHHYGLENFEQTGAVLITVLNRGYCKKLIVMFAGQNHPPHFHLDRDESLCLLQGKAELILDGKPMALRQDDYCHLLKGSSHEIMAFEDSVIEEISIMSEVQTSHYLDEQINKQPRAARKTQLSFSETSRQPGDKPRELE